MLWSRKLGPSTVFSSVPVSTQRQDNVASTSMQRHDVVSTLYRRHMPAGVSVFSALKGDSFQNLFTSAQDRTFDYWVSLLVHKHLQNCSLGNKCHPDQTPQNAASDQGLHWFAGHHQFTMTDTAYLYIVFTLNTGTDRQVWPNSLSTDQTLQKAASDQGIH